MSRRIDAPSTSTSSSNKIAASTKFKIQQAVSSNFTKKGPYAVERAVDPNDVVIKRRFGEGSKPLFERDDISINRRESKDLSTSAVKFAQDRTRGKSSSSSSSPEHYRQRGLSYSSLTTSPKSKLKHIKRKTPEKIPYFRDEKREEERLIRTYGSSNAVLNKRAQKNSKNHSSTLRSRSYSRSRSRSPRKNFSAHSKSTSFQKYKHSKIQRLSHKLHFARSNHHSPHDRHRSLSNERRTKRHRRSKSRSRSRSHSNDHYKRGRSSERRDGGREHEAPKPTTQIITIPVPVDPYGYPAAYPAWSHQPTWPAAAQGAPRYATPYPLPPVMSPFVGPAIFPPFRPPPPAPYGIPYTPRMFRPPRFYSRPPRGNFRPRNY